MLVEDKYTKATLEWCNERRAEKNQEPLDDLPKGKRGDPYTCPCGAATGLAVNFTVAHNMKSGAMSKSFELPSLVARFVNRFDKGQYPEYNVRRDTSCQV